jgi:rubrerythrin
MTYTVKDILNIALIAEEEAELYYHRMEETTSNVFLKEKLAYLATEEKRHHAIILKLMEREGVRVALHDAHAASELPSLLFDSTQPMSVLIERAMEGEDAARSFYEKIAEDVTGAEERAMLGYLAQMEASHYAMLEAELDALKHFEDYDAFSEMMHAGP